MKQNNFFIVLLVAGFTTIMTAQVPSYVPTNGLVGYWPFNGNANDVSTNANNGTNNGATLTTDRFGNANSAYSFDGTTNYISVLNNSSLNPSSITISGWINSNANAINTQNGARAIVTKWNQIQDCGGDGANFTVQLSYLNNENVIACATSQNNQITNAVKSSTDVIGLNTWKHFVFIHDPLSGQKLYINGILITINNILGNLCATTNNLYFGADKINAGLWRYFNGKLDDISMWNRALTQTEITNLYNANICYENITVTDTLIINLGTLSYNPVTYNNSITIYPNPAKDRITIDYGTLSAVTGYQIKISNLLGQEVFSTTLNQQQYSIPLNSWTGKGIYLVTVYDANRNLLTTRKIDLQ